MTNRHRLKAALFGGTGLIGGVLAKSLNQKGYEVSIFTRNPDRKNNDSSGYLKYVKFDNNIGKFLEGMDVIINLAGEPISRRWSKGRRKRIILSRVETMKKISEAVNTLDRKPAVFIQASATGYYPFSREDEFTEVSAKGNSFLSHVVCKWERSSEALDEKIRKIIIRTGVVLSNRGGMLPKVIFPIRFFLGGIPGDGKNWISWIHIDDIIAVISFLIDADRSSGVYNLTSPEPVKLGDMIRYCGSVLKRPVLFHIPEFFIRAMFGQMGVETILSSQKVIPERLISEGYVFQFSNYKEAIKKELK